MARSCVCGANRRLFNTALEFLKLVYQDSGSRAGRTRGVIAPRVALLRLPVAQQICIPDLRPRPVAPSCGWELKVWITLDSAAALVDEKTAQPVSPAAPLPACGRPARGTRSLTPAAPVRGAFQCIPQWPATQVLTRGSSGRPKHETKKETSKETKREPEKTNRNQQT